MIHTWYKDTKNKKLHYVLNLRYHSNKNIMPSVKFPKNVIFKAISLLSARIHPKANNSYKFKLIHIRYTNARNKKVNILFRIYVTMATQISKISYFTLKQHISCMLFLFRKCIYEHYLQSLNKRLLFSTY